MSFSACIVGALEVGGLATRLCACGIGFLAVPNISTRKWFDPMEFKSSLLCINKLAKLANIVEFPFTPVLNKLPLANNVANWILPTLFILDSKIPEATILELNVDIPFIWAKAYRIAVAFASIEELPWIFADAFTVPESVAKVVAADSIEVNNAPLPVRREFTVDIAVIIALIVGVAKTVEFEFTVDDSAPDAVKFDETVELLFIVDDSSK